MSAKGLLQLSETRDLFESERRFRLLVEGVVDYAIYMLDPSGRISNWNAGAERTKGYRASEIIGQHFSIFYTPEDRDAGKPAKSLETAAIYGKFEAEGWRVRKDGSRFRAFVVIDAIFEHGELIGFAKITRDVTERHEAQLKLEKVQRQLAEAQKMDALGQLTGGVAHDFNNLLMVVSGHVQTIKKVLTDDPKIQRAAHAIEQAAQRGAALTRQLLTFSRRQRVNPQAVDIAARIEAINDLLSSGLGKNIRLVFDIAPNAWLVTVDLSEFEIALVNLIVNARDAMPKGGTVTVSAVNRCVDEEPLYGDYVALSVRDTGVGIPDDVLSKVFDPFFTTKPVGKGTGLGLSQVHGFVHQAGGTVTVESELGNGTTITMYLPRASSNTLMNGKEEGVLAPTTHTGTVLLVEDNPDVASASAELLHQLGYVVRWVPDATTALQEIESNGIDVVFSDIVMPGAMDGFGLVEAIKQKHPKLPVLLVTGYSEAAQAAPADLPILRKPYQIHELSRALSDLTRLQSRR